MIVAWVAATLASVAVAIIGIAGVRTAIATPDSFRLPPEAAAPATTDPPSTHLPEHDGTNVTLNTSVTTTTVAFQPPATDGETTDDDEGITTTSNPTPTTNGQQKTYENEGGWVSISTDSQGVHFESASPKAGWNVTVEEQGPEEVVVVFKTTGEEIHFKARFEDGSVRIEIEEDDDD